MVKDYIKIVFICWSTLCISQSDSTYYYFNLTTSKKKIQKKIEHTNDASSKNYFKLIYYSKLKEPDSMVYYIKSLKNSKNISDKKLSRILYFEGYYHKLTDNDSLFFKMSNQAYQKALTINDTLTILHSLSALAQSYDYKNDVSYNLEYLNLLEKRVNIYQNNSFKIIHQFLKGNYYLFRDNSKDAISNYTKLLNYNFTKLDSTFILYTYNNLGALYETVIENSDSAIYYYKKKINFLEKNPDHTSSESYFNTYLNIANSYLTKKQFKKAEYYYLKADSIESKTNILFNKSMVKENLADLYENFGNYKLAYTNLKEYNILSDSLKKEEQRISIANIKEKYDNEKLRSNNLESETKRLESEAKQKQNKNIAIGLGGSLVLGSIIAFLLFRISKRKQLLAEQEKALETQKLATVLKEQELTSIDAMIEGQEKERQRIANDLHDDLGGLMATVKLHFNALKDKNSPELFDKTNQLIDEAYNKVRTVAHAKNSGVIAKQGLLKAVQNMAEKISASNKIAIDVVDYGLENRLENSLELTIFRIIQELITNVIKHAEAKEATIHITNHDDSLNIMIEDNGKGFNPSQVTKNNKGMGISSIDKRVEHLNGNMTIESEHNKGTTIIIDIPI